MKILSKPKGNAEEYGRWSVNPFVGCPNGCSYCYLKKGVWANNLGGNVPTLKAGLVAEGHAYHVAMAEIFENREQIIKDGGLFMTFTSDPCILATRQLMFRIAAGAIGNGIPVSMLTKDATFYQFPSMEKMILDAPKRCSTKEEVKVMVRNGIHFITWFDGAIVELVKSLAAFGFTLTGHDEMEPNASPNADRIQTLKMMSADGFKTWASIEPVIDFPSSYDMIQAAINADCRHFKIGLLTKNTKVCRKMYDYDACIEFIHDVMRVMEAGGGTATVYWKQSFRDFLGEEDFARATVGYKNIVGKDWSMFE